jgi:hypothetical protein
MSSAELNRLGTYFTTETVPILLLTQLSTEDGRVSGEGCCGRGAWLWAAAGRGSAFLVLSLLALLIQKYKY